MPLTSLTNNQPRLFRILLITEIVLFLMLVVGVAWLRSRLPDEGVKLHGNVDTGVDLLGTRNELWWLAGIGGAVVAVNGILARFLAPRDAVAVLFLFGTTIAVLVLFLVSLLVVAQMNLLFSSRTNFQRGISAMLLFHTPTGVRNTRGVSIGKFVRDVRPALTCGECGAS